MKINSKTRLLGLFGNPARHSLSPLLQNYFLNYYGYNYVYLTFELEPGKLREAFEGVKNLGFLGLNITMPFKESIIDYIQKISGPASVIGAVNTVKFTNGGKESYGYSTDGDGVIKALVDKKFDWEGKNCLILGAGGAAKSAVFSIIQKPLNRIYIYDIVKNKAARMLEEFGLNLKSIPTDKNDIKINWQNVTLLSSLGSIEKDLDTIDLIINCTPSGMDEGDHKGLMPVPERWILKDKYIFDMVYKPVETRLLKKARKENAAGIINGIDMLVSQGVYSFRIWFDIMPEDIVIKQAKDKIKNYISQQY